MKLEISPRSPEAVAVRKLARASGLSQQAVVRVAIARIAERHFVSGSVDREAVSLIQFEAFCLENGADVPLREVLLRDVYERLTGGAA